MITWIQITSRQEVSKYWKRLSNERKIHYRKKQKINNIERKMDRVEYITRYKLGRINQICIYYNAKFW